MSITAIIYDFQEFGDKGYNIQLTGLTQDDKYAIRIAVASDAFPRDSHHFFQGDSNDWMMIEFWTKDLKVINKACRIILSAVDLSTEDAYGWFKIEPKETEVDNV